jgi:hypothetical protein
MPPTQIRGSQILDGSINSDDIDDALEKEFTKVRVSSSDSTPDYLSAKVVPGSNVTITVVGASGSNQTLRIAASGGGGGGSSLTISGSKDDTQFSGAPATLLFDDQTGFEVQDLGSGTTKVSIASHYKNIFVNGQPTLIATGSDSVELKGAGGVVLTTSVTDSDADGIAKELTISTSALSSSIASSIDDLNARAFTAATSSLPYYNASAIPVTLPPPSGERSGYVLGWVNNQLAWVALTVGASFMSPTWAEISLEGKIIESGVIDVSTGTVL